MDIQKRSIGTAIAAVAAVMLTVTACSTGGGGGSGDGGESSSLTFASWGGAFQDAQHEAFVLPFTEETGVRVQEDGPTDYSKVKVQVETGNVDWDVVTVEPFWAEQQCGTLLQSLDDIDRSDLIEGAGSECGVPVSATAFVLGYNAETYADEAPTSWADFYDTEKFPGKRAVWNYAPGQAFETALLADGVKPEDLYPLDIPRALQKLDTIRDDIVFSTRAHSSRRCSNRVRHRWASPGTVAGTTPQRTAPLSTWCGTTASCCSM